MANNNQLTAQQRAALFGASTRQHWQMIGKQEVTGGAQTIQFRVPKARILRGMKLWVEAKMKIKHSSSTSIALPSSVAPSQLSRLIPVDFSHGSRPIAVAGDDLAFNHLL